jgi:hypothetical protein
MNKLNNEIITAAKTAHQQFWRATSDESTGDKQASAVTKTWQHAVESEHIRPEVPVAVHLQEKIDLVDFSTATAYEMKVSGKNAGHEFYKDIFKVLVYNQHKDQKLRTLVFITEQHGADKLNRGLGEAVIEAVRQDTFLDILVIGI